MSEGLIPGIAALADDMTAWRRDIHAHPEMAFEETRTARLVADKLNSFGIEVHTGLAQTGVVGVLKNGDGPMIGLRADMDALPLIERTGLAYASTHHGKMHACGHDGHTAMLLGAAAHLARERNFTGTVVFIFQPAEEGEGGARVMVEDGLFERFPVERVFGLHNWPGMDVGTFAVKPGPVMAAIEAFDARITGKGAHGGMPHLGLDAVTIAAQVISAWHNIVSRTVDPFEAAVISVTDLHAGEGSCNVIPEHVDFKGALRCFDEDLRTHIWSRMEGIGQGLCQGFGAQFTLKSTGYYPATVNSAEEAEIAAAAAASVVGLDNVQRTFNSSLGAEDFAYMLDERPGCYVWMGNGPGTGGCTLHNPQYDFNDDALAFGASYWVRLVEQQLG